MLKKAISLVVLSSFVFTIVYGDLAYVYAQEKPKKPRIAVLPLTDTNSASKREEYGEAIAGMLMTELINGKIFQVVERSEIDRIMKEMAFQISGAVDAGTAKQLGELLGVDIMVLGTVAKFGSLVETDIRLIDTESGEALLAEHESSQSAREIRNMVSNLAQKIAQRYLGRLADTVQITSEPSGANVIIDGIQAGQTPLTKSLSRGPHQIRIVKENYSDWQRTVQVAAGQNNINARLAISPEYANKQAEARRQEQERRRRLAELRDRQRRQETSEKGGSNALVWVGLGALVAGGVAAAVLLGGKKEEKNTS